MRKYIMYYNVDDNKLDSIPSIVDQLSEMIGKKNFFPEGTLLIIPVRKQETRIDVVEFDD